MRVCVLGAGMVGSAIIADLAQDKNLEVLAIDRDQAALDRVRQRAPLLSRAVQADLGQVGDVPTLVKDADLVVSAVPGLLGTRTLEAVIRAGKNVVDISFSPEDPFLLDDLACTLGVTAVVDCGVAPGLCNIIAGYVSGQLEVTDRYECYVGGLPEVRVKPYEYRVVFSAVDVLEEYTRPARFRENGQPVTRPALSDVEQLDMPGVGTLEAFNTDGLRSLLHTLPIPTMREKTLRYPGHAALMQVLRDSGFFSTTPVELRGASVAPMDLTSRLLFHQWRMPAGERDLTVMLVRLDGQASGRRVRREFYLLDRFDDASQTTSMARTTGYTCSLVARLVLCGQFARRGICPPEFIGQTPGCFDWLRQEYEKRGIWLTESTRQL
ncbi:MAG TPA: saccharopine dehydrogenase C-terminal domain-containing protein [Anaerolineae bacterium]|nr:saccharopine dehydrogenase C-terminal domain-containing protein [Anaerolineae bacterium]